MLLTEETIHRVVQMALAEDAPTGDLTTTAFVAEKSVASAALVAREPGILSGQAVFEAAMTATGADVEVTWYCQDAQEFTADETLAKVTGPARAILTSERVALNFLQRMCGIATATARYVDAVAGTTTRIVDTRKTTPGLRAFEREAVRCGGGYNHRAGLSDAVMAKDNHLAVIDDVAAAITAARQQLPHTTHIEVEVDSLDQIDAALAGGADTIMLDNFSLEELRNGVERIAGRALVEASGGVTLESVAAIAATGVDLISVGALTHGPRALDLGLDISATPSLHSSSSGSNTNHNGRASG